jgi:hypothetical protein
MAKPATINSKSLAESVPPYARQNAKTNFFILWHCAISLLGSDIADKNEALKKLENIKQNYGNIKTETLCLHNPYGRDMLNYFSGLFDNHQIGKFYQSIKNAYHNKNPKELNKISSKLEKIVKGFYNVYCP